MATCCKYLFLLALFDSNSEAERRIFIYLQIKQISGGNLNVPTVNILKTAKLSLLLKGDQALSSYTIIHNNNDGMGIISIFV